MDPSSTDSSGQIPYCNFFKNIGNKADTAYNHESNYEVTSNYDSSSNYDISSNHDILDFLKYHPDFERNPPDIIQPFIAGALSGVMLVAGALTVYVFCPHIALGATVHFLVNVFGGALVAGGTAGVKNAFQHGMKGTFTWIKWTEDVTKAAAVATVTASSAILANWATTYCLLQSTQLTSTSHVIHVATSARIASVSVDSAVSGCADTLLRVIDDEEIHPAYFVFSVVMGALQGYQTATELPETMIRSAANNMEAPGQLLLDENLMRPPVLRWKKEAEVAEKILEGLEASSHFIHTTTKDEQDH